MVQKRIMLQTIPKNVNLSNSSTNRTQTIACSFLRALRGSVGRGDAKIPWGRWPSRRSNAPTGGMLLLEVFLWKWFKCRFQSPLLETETFSHSRVKSCRYLTTDLASSHYFSLLRFLSNVYRLLLFISVLKFSVCCTLEGLRLRVKIVLMCRYCALLMMKAVSETWDILM